MAQSGQPIWLSGIGTLHIYLDAPPRGAKGKLVAPMRFVAELRGWLGEGVGANHAVWIEIYEWLGRPLPKPPRREDLTSMADAFVDAFESGRLVAIERPAAARVHEGRRSSDSASVSERAPATVRDEPPAEAVKTWVALVLVDQDGYPVPSSGCCSNS